MPPAIFHSTKYKREIGGCRDIYGNIYDLCDMWKMTQGHYVSILRQVFDACFFWFSGWQENEEVVLEPWSHPLDNFKIKWMQSSNRNVLIFFLCWNLAGYINPIYGMHMAININKYWLIYLLSQCYGMWAESMQCLYVGVIRQWMETQIGHHTHIWAMAATHSIIFLLQSKLHRVQIAKGNWLLQHSYVMYGHSYHGSIQYILIYDKMDRMDKACLIIIIITIIIITIIIITIINMNIIIIKITIIIITIIIITIIIIIIININIITINITIIIIIRYVWEFVFGCLRVKVFKSKFLGVSLSIIYITRAYEKIDTFLGKNLDFPIFQSLVIFGFQCLKFLSFLKGNFVCWSLQHIFPFCIFSFFPVFLNFPIFLFSWSMRIFGKDRENFQYSMWVQNLEGSMLLTSSNVNNTCSKTFVLLITSSNVNNIAFFENWTYYFQVCLKVESIFQFLDKIYLLDITSMLLTSSTVNNKYSMIYGMLLTSSNVNNTAIFENWAFLDVIYLLDTSVLLTSSTVSNKCSMISGMLLTSSNVNNNLGISVPFALDGNLPLNFGKGASLQPSSTDHHDVPLGLIHHAFRSSCPPKCRVTGSTIAKTTVRQVMVNSCVNSIEFGCSNVNNNMDIAFSENWTYYFQACLKVGSIFQLLDENYFLDITSVFLVWFGLVWFGLVWFGLVWFGLVVLGAPVLLGLAPLPLQGHPPIGGWFWVPPLLRGLVVVWSWFGGFVLLVGGLGGGVCWAFVGGFCPPPVRFSTVFCFLLCVSSVCVLVLLVSCWGPCQKSLVCVMCDVFFPCTLLPGLLLWLWLVGIVHI